MNGPLVCGHALRPNNDDSVGRLEVANKRLSCFGLIGRRAERRCENHFLLQFSWELPDNVQTRGSQHVKEENSKLGLTAGDRLNDLCWR